MIRLIYNFNKNMKYKNNSNETLEIPGIWKILPWTIFETDLNLALEDRIIIVKEEKITKKENKNII